MELQITHMRKNLTWLVLILLVPLLYACSGPINEPGSTSDPAVGLANPASVHCEEQGGRLEIRTTADGGQYGVCIFEDGSECEEWAYFRAECQPGELEDAPAPQGSPAYTNAEYGFSFDSPAEWTIEGYEDRVFFIRTTPDGGQYLLFVGFQPTNDQPEHFRIGQGDGELQDAEPITFLDSQITKQELLHQGKIKSVFYATHLPAGDVLLSIYLDPFGDDIDYSTLDIPPEIITEADQIVSSFTLIP
jgi:putative hemolysin